MNRERRAKPIFAEIPNELDETCRHGFIVGGMARVAGSVELARAYIGAGDLIVDHAMDQGGTCDLAYPVLFLYRHAIELYLKAAVRPTKRNHDLTSLTSQFVGVVFSELGETVPEWFIAHVQEFAGVDPGATTFRYIDDGERDRVIDKEEAWVELRHLRHTMRVLAENFESVLRALRM